MILFFYGPNSYAARQKIKELVGRFKQSSGHDFGLERFDGADPNLTADQVISAISSVPFLSPHRLVIVEDLLMNKDLADKILANLDQVPRVNVVIFYEPSPDERTKVFKQLKATAQTHKFESLTPDKLLNWVKKLTQENGAQIDTPTARFLIERAGTEQWKLANEIAKLSNFNPQINKEAIAELVDPSFEQTIFDLIEFLYRGQTGQAMQLYRGLRRAKAEPLYILSMLGWGLRNLIIAKAAKGKPSGEISKDFQISPYVLGKAQAIADKLEIETLEHAHQQLIGTDFKLKTINLDPDAALEQLLVGIGSQMGLKRA